MTAPSFARTDRHEPFGPSAERRPALPLPTGVVGRREDGYYEIHDLTLAAWMMKAAPGITNIAQYRSRIDGRWFVILSNPNPKMPEIGFQVLERIRMQFPMTDVAAVDGRVGAIKRSAITLESIPRGGKT